MAAPSSSSGNWLTTVYPNIWTNVTHLIIISIAAAVAIASPTTLSSTSTLLPSFISSSTVSISFLALPGVSAVSSSDGEALEESSIPTTLSGEEQRRYLDKLQEDTTLRLIPTVIFLATLAVVGLIGNTLVLLVYSKKNRRSATDILIMAMAMSDLVANVCAIPGEIYDTFHFWDLDMPLLCKCRVYVNALTTLSSALCLLAIAVSRFRKICRSFGKQISPKHAKIISVVIAFCSALFSIPNAIVYGPQTKTVITGITGRQCFTDDKYVNTIWPMIYMAFLMLLFFGCCIPLIVLYVLIGVQAWRHSTIHGIPTTDNTPINSANTLSDTLDSTDDTDGKNKVWRFFRQKNKKKTDNGNFRDEEDVDNENRARITGKPKNIKEQHPSSNNEEKAVDEGDDIRTKMMSLPVKVKSPMDNSVREEISLKLVKDSGIKTRENIDRDNESVELKTEDLKLDDTLTGISEGSEKSIANIEMQNPSKKAMTPIARCGDNQNIAYSLTVTGTDVEDLKGVKSSGNKSPRNATLDFKSGKNKSNSQRRGLTRTTLMLLIISAIFVIAFVPYLVLIGWKYAVPDIQENMSAVGFAIYHVFLRFYFINSAANAIIYSLCDIRFRNEVKKIMRCKT